MLLASGIDLGGRVGKGLHVLGGAVRDRRDATRFDGFDGIGLTCVAEASDDYVIESYFAPPVVFSLRLGGWFLSHFNRMLRYRHFIDGGVMVGTDPAGGRVSLDRKGSVKIDLKLVRARPERLRAGLKTIARIYLAGGARRVFPSTFKYLESATRTDLERIDRDVRKPDDLLFGSAHPQGGNPMHRDPSHGVVGEDFARARHATACTSPTPASGRATSGPTARRP